MTVRHAILIFLLIVSLIVTGLLWKSNDDRNKAETNAVRKTIAGTYSPDVAFKSFQVAQCKFELSVADSAFKARWKQGMDFHANITPIQNRWKLAQWQAYACIMEKLVLAQDDLYLKMQVYHYKLISLNLDEQSFDAWYDEVVAHQSDPKGFIAKNLEPVVEEMD